MFKIYFILLAIDHINGWIYKPGIVSFYLTNDYYNDLLITSETIKFIQPNLNIVIYTHGWRQNSSFQSVTQLKHAFQLRNNSNFIKTDWGELAHANYLQAALRVCTVGQNVGQFIAELNNLKYNLKRVHTIGLSLGAHISGTAGRVAYKLTKKNIGRVTGLDPAGPLFLHIFKYSIGCILDKMDAQFVDIIHTNAIVYGTLQNLGSANFYANCGTNQPGCKKVTLTNFMVNQRGRSCSHDRSLELFTESVNSNKFLASHAHHCKHNVVYGLNMPLNSSGDYYFKTYSNSPYAMGDKGACQSCKLGAVISLSHVLSFLN